MPAASLLAALDELGMSVSRAAATELIQERVQWVSAQMGISPTAARRYLTDDALADLARTMVVSFADETPGADVIESARTARYLDARRQPRQRRCATQRTPAPPMQANSQPRSHKTPQHCFTTPASRPASDVLAVRLNLLVVR